MNEVGIRNNRTRRLSAHDALLLPKPNRIIPVPQQILVPETQVEGLFAGGHLRAENRSCVQLYPIPIDVPGNW